MTRSEQRAPTLPTTRVEPGSTVASAAVAFATSGGVIAILVIGLFVLALPIHALMVIAICWTALCLRSAGVPYAALRKMMTEGIAEALPAVFVFFLIGMVIASLMVSGTVATLMVLGLDWLTPQSFLVIGFVLCVLMSLATGTSWGTVGTAGIVLMGIGTALDVSAPLVAGVVISGATFGDKMSPVSDTTNLAAMSAGTDLFAHIRAMLWTTIPTALIVIAVLVVLGGADAEGPMPAAAAELRSALDAHFTRNWVVGLVPIAVMLGLSWRRLAPEVCMIASTASALLLAFVYQDRTASELVSVLWQNTPTDTGIAELDALLGRGGMASMSWTLMLALLALALGGMLLRGGVIEALITPIIARAERPMTLVAATIGTGFLGNAALGEAYVSILLTAQSYRDAFARRGLPAPLLSRSVEEGATLTTGLIPWTTAGAFYAATLGVPTLEYAPYALLNYLNPIVAIGMAALGVGLLGARGQR
jgi:NhaC family Na+:H+ antiporter